MGNGEWFMDGYNIPKRLPKDELYDLLTKKSQGDMDARKKLIEHNIRLVIYQVKGRFSTVDYDKSELVSIGILGLVKAIDTYDLSKNVEFSSYATRCIDNEILMFLRKLKYDKVVESFDRPISDEGTDNELRLGDMIKSNINIEESYENKEVYAIIRKIVNELPERERIVIMLYFGFYDGRIYKQREIATVLNVSRSQVSRIITKIVNDIRKKLEKIGIVDLDLVTRRQKTITENHPIEIKPYQEIPEEHPSNIKPIVDLTKPVEPKQKNTKGVKGMSKKVQTLYEYFKDYSREQIDLALSQLSEEERLLVNKRYGNNLTNPHPSKLTTDESNKFYGSIIPKIKRKLKAINKKQPKKQENSSNEEPEDAGETTPQILSEPIIEFTDEKEEQAEEPITKEDYLKMLELLRSPKFSKMLNRYSAKEKVIISLKLGYIDGKCFSTEAISKFLGLPEQEIITITQRVLQDYRNMINSIFDGTIRMVTEKQEEKVFKKTQ